MSMVDKTLATVDETLDLLGCSVSAIDETIATSGSREEALQMKLQKLIAQTSPIIRHRKNLKKDALILFVHLLEVADQYYDFKKVAKQAYYFKRAHSAIVIFDTLLADQQLKSKFSQIGETEIMQAADVINRELCDEHYGTDSASSIITDWIYKLVFQARETGYVMDQEPIAELEKMMKFEPDVYDDYFGIHPFDINPFDMNPLPVKCTMAGPIGRIGRICGARKGILLEEFDKLKVV